MCKVKKVDCWNALFIVVVTLALPAQAKEEGGGTNPLFGVAKIIEAAQPIGKAAADAAADVGIAAAQAAGNLGKMSADAGAQMYKSKMNLEMQRNNLETAKEIAKINWENTLKREKMEREERLKKFYEDLRLAQLKDERNSRNRFYASMINYSQVAAQMQKDNMILRMGILGLLGQNSFNFLNTGGNPLLPANSSIGMDQLSPPPSMFGLRNPSEQLLSNLNTKVRGIGIPRANPRILRASTPAVVETTVPNTSSFPYRTAQTNASPAPVRSFTSHGGYED